MSQSSHDCMDQFLLSQFINKYGEDSVMSSEFINIVMSNWRFYVAGNSKESSAYLNLFKVKQALLFDFPKFVPIYEGETPMVLILIMQFYYFLRINREISKDDYFQVIDLIQQHTVNSINNMSNDEIWGSEKEFELYGGNQQELYDQVDEDLSGPQVNNVVSYFRDDKKKD